MLPQERFLKIIEQYRQDADSVYQTWFVDNGARLKAFRSIRTGVQQVVDDIRGGSFPNDFRGSSLEFVLTCITEQKQVFEGAAHAFYWKPKLRIPDIYENERNKIAFGLFLENCLSASREEHLLREIDRLDGLKIKGLGPAVANILYFLHPTLLPPCNTAILNGFNLLFGTKNKLGSWTSYLDMRQLLMEANEQFRPSLSKDLGAISGLFFEIGAGKLVLEENAEIVLSAETRKREALQSRRRLTTQDDVVEAEAHTQMQYLLSRIGQALGYDVFVAVNDRGKTFHDAQLSQCCIERLPSMGLDEDVAATVELIDILWLERGAARIICAFEVEKSTSIYSGILRLSDLALALPDHQTRLCLVIPNAREKEVVAQLNRPSFLAGSHRRPSYLLFSDLAQHCDAICRFGADHRVLEKILKTVEKPSVRSAMD